MAEDKEATQQQKASITHGMYALQNTGESTLTPKKRGRLQELKDLFNSEPGRVEYRRNLAAHLAMMMELGFSDLAQRVQNGQSIWTSPPVARMGIYMNALIRLLDGWPKEGTGAIDITELLKGKGDDKPD